MSAGAIISAHTSTLKKLPCVYISPGSSDTRKACVEIRWSQIATDLCSLGKFSKGWGSIPEFSPAFLIFYRNILVLFVFYALKKK